MFKILRKKKDERIMYSNIDNTSIHSSVSTGNSSKIIM